MRFYTDTELGPKQALLPSGALLFRFLAQPTALRDDV